MIPDISQIAAQPVNFSFNPNLIVKEINQIQDGFLKTPRSTAKIHSSNDHVMNSHHHYSSRQVNDSFDQYLSLEQPIRQTPAPHRFSARKNEMMSVSRNLQTDSYQFDNEEDFDSHFSLPKPQPQPTITPMHVSNLESSRFSHKTATFVNGSDQTFTPDGLQGIESGFGSLCGRNQLTDSLKLLDNPLTSSDMKLSQRYHHHRQDSEKLSPLAEKLLQQQAQQLKFLQQQIVNLQVNKNIPKVCVNMLTLQGDRAKSNE